MTNTDKLKEFVMFLAMSKDLQCCISDTQPSKQHGVAYLKSFSYSIGDLLITYNKYVVENYEDAKRMGLEGCDYHDKLIGGVMVLSKKFGSKTFYGKNARDIINTCEDSYNKILFEREVNSKER